MSTETRRPRKVISQGQFEETTPKSNRTRSKGTLISPWILCRDASCSPARTSSRTPWRNQPRTAGTRTLDSSTETRTRTPRRAPSSPPLTHISLPSSPNFPSSLFKKISPKIYVENLVENACRECIRTPAPFLCYITDKFTLFCYFSFIVGIWSACTVQFQLRMEVVKRATTHRAGTFTTDNSLRPLTFSLHTARVERPLASKCRL